MKRVGEEKRMDSNNIHLRIQVDEVVPDPQGEINVVLDDLVRSGKLNHVVPDSGLRDVLVSN